MLAKIARSTPRRSFVLPKVTVADQTSFLSCRKATKARIFTSDGSHLANPGLDKRLASVAFVSSVTWSFLRILTASRISMASCGAT